MTHAWTKNYFAIINGEGYQLAVNFRTESDLEHWEFMIDETANAVQNIYYAIYMEEDNASIEALAEAFLVWAENLRRHYGNERVPQNIRLKVHHFERLLNISHTNFGTDHGVYVDRIGGVA